MAKFWAAVVLAVVTAASVVMVLAADDPLQSLMLGTGLLLLIAAAFKPRVAGSLTVLLAATALPAIVPSAIWLGQTQVQAYEPFLWVFAIQMMKYGPWSAPRLSAFWWALACFLGAAGLSIVWGLSSGNAVGAVFADHRQLVNLALGAIAAYGSVRAGYANMLLRTLLASLWISAGLMIAASTGAIELFGRSEAAQLYLATGGLLGGEASATRLLSPATFPALATLCIAAAGVALSTVRLQLALAASLPAVVVIFLGFSRNHLVAVAVTIVGALLLAALRGRGVSAAGRTAIAVLAAGAFMATAVGLSTPGSWLSVQVDAYASRVIEGLTPEAQARDSSAQDREVENEYMLDAIANHPLTGTGAGHAYKPPAGPAGGFAASGGQYYGHNYYLWILMKVGPLGLASYLAVLAFAFAAGVRASSADAWRLSVACTIAALAVVTIVAPLPNGSPTAVMLGVVLGLAVSQLAPGDPKTEALRALHRGGKSL